MSDSGEDPGPDRKTGGGVAPPQGGYPLDHCRPQQRLQDRTSVFSPQHLKTDVTGISPTMFLEKYLLPVTTKMSKTQWLSCEFHVFCAVLLLLLVMVPESAPLFPLLDLLLDPSLSPTPCSHPWILSRIRPWVRPGPALSHPHSFLII